jgi:thiol-disulfide isomerase/thioredoxin
MSTPPARQRRALSALSLALALCAAGTPAIARAADLSRLVRLKLSAGDLLSGEAAVEEYRKTKGVDADYLDAVGWLARGAALLGRYEKADVYVAELRREIRDEKPELVVPLGAAIEVEARLRAAREGRGAAVRFLETEAAHAKDVSLRSRIFKNVNLLTLEGNAAPPLSAADHIGADVPALSDLRGKAVLLFLWAHGCGDCKAQGPIVARVYEKLRARGLVLVAPTRYYGEDADWKSGATPEQEKALIEKDWTAFTGLSGVPIPIDTESMVRYGVSATPTLVLIDRKGIVRLYTPTRMSEAELTRRVEEALADNG